MSTRARLCPHADKPWRCVTCCIAALYQARPRLTYAISHRDKATADGPRPGFGSREPINLSALALVQDLNRHGGVRGLEAAIATGNDPELPRKIRQYRSRAALILHDALAPYPLRGDVRQPDGTIKEEPYRCPVITEAGTCGAPLWVHRDDDQTSSTFGKPAAVVCYYDDTHEWSSSLDWMRLGLMFVPEDAA